MFSRALSMWAAVVGMGCVSAQPVLVAPSGEEVTLFVHGYKGAFLQTAEGQLAWLHPRQAFSSGDTSLALGFEGQRDFQRYGPLTVSGALTRLMVVPGLIQETLYLPWLEFGRDRLPGFMVFAYDWRQDVRQTASALCERIESLGPNRRVRIVAHSMGGLVTLQCLRHGSAAARAMVSHVVFVGVPFKGTPAPWDDLFLGNPTARNRALLSAEALLTFSSTWQLLPPTADFFFDSQRRPTPVDAFSGEAWLKHGWGLFGEPELKDNAGYRAQLTARLEAHQGLWAGLGDEEGEQPSWKSLTVIGTGRTTVSGFVANRDGSFDFTQALTEDGDGTVETSRAMAPKPIRGPRVDTTAEHAVMLNESGVQAAIADFLSR